MDTSNQKKAAVFFNPGLNIIEEVIVTKYQSRTSLQVSPQKIFPGNL